MTDPAPGSTNAEGKVGMDGDGNGQGRSAQHEVTPVNFLSRVRIANGPGIVSQDYLSGFLCENDEEFLPHLRDRVLTSGIVFLTCVAVKVSIVQQCAWRPLSNELEIANLVANSKKLIVYRIRGKSAAPRGRMKPSAALSI